MSGIKEKLRIYQECVVIGKPRGYPNKECDGCSLEYEIKESLTVCELIDLLENE